MNARTGTIKKNSFFILIFLFLIFVIPLLLAWILYEEGDKAIHQTTNHGQLLQPPVQISQLQLKNSADENFDQQQLHGKWLMLYILPTACNSSCEKNLYFMRQIRLATGKNMERIQRVIVVFPRKKLDNHLNNLLQNDYAGTIKLEIDSKQFEKTMISSPTTSLAMSQGYLYLVDPLGNIMMGYNVNANPSDIFKDLQKLLRISQIG